MRERDKTHTHPLVTKPRGKLSHSAAATNQHHLVKSRRRIRRKEGVTAEWSREELLTDLFASGRVNPLESLSVTLTAALNNAIPT